MNLLKDILDHLIKQKIKAHNTKYNYKLNKAIDYIDYPQYLCDLNINDPSLLINLDDICIKENQKSFIEHLKCLIDTTIKSYLDVEISEDEKRIKVKQFDPRFKMYLAEKEIIKLQSHTIFHI